MKTWIKITLLVIAVLTIVDPSWLKAMFFTIVLKMFCGPLNIWGGGCGTLNTGEIVSRIIWGIIWLFVAVLIISEIVARRKGNGSDVIPPSAGLRQEDDGEHSPSK
jgi:hypothetical protein